MKSARFAGWAAGVALFYGTYAGVCQSIPVGAAARPQPAQGATGGRTAIRLISSGGKADGLTAESCKEVLAVLLPAIQAYPHPSDWTWFVACDEAAWVQIQRREGNQVGSGILAITNRPLHATIVRGSAMLHAYSDDYRAQPEHIVAHELCHIYLQSSDEFKVDELATRWVEERRARHLAVLKP